MNKPSKETIELLLQFMKKTSLPRVIESQQKQKGA
jgi:hypothetical protein